MSLSFYALACRQLMATRFVLVPNKHKNSIHFIRLVMNKMIIILRQLVIFLVLCIFLKFSHGTPATRQDRMSFNLGFKSRNQLRPQCGQPIRTYSQRIVGGKIASIADFPWIISLQREKSYWFGFRTFQHSCGGSLITPSWIVTAAHCLYNRDEPLRAVAGADNLNLLYRAQIRGVTKTIMHPLFDIATYDNDIALIKVARPYDLESSFSHVGTICLEPDVAVEPYDIATICGFGAQAFHKKGRTHLYKTEIAIIDQQVCNQSFDNSITDNMVCAGGMIQHKRDACSGDSGGPLQLEVENHLSLIGVVSFGNDCASKGYPGVYTRLNNYFSWITSLLDEPLIEP